MSTAIARADAIAVVQSQAATEQAPTLTTPEVEKIVDRSARRDIDGTPPGDADWIETYDLNTATALAWERKAALTATSKFDIAIDNQTLTRSQVYQQCMAQAAHYRGKNAGTLSRGQVAPSGVSSAVSF